LVATGYIVGGSLGLIALGAGLSARNFFRPLRAYAVPILRYRMIGPPLAGSPFNSLRVTAPAFQQHLDYIARRGFHLVTLSEALSNLGSREFLESKPVVLTFDGGYKTLDRYVRPAMEDYGFKKFTMFVATEGIGQDNSYETGGRGRPEPMLDKTSLREFANMGVEIGSLGRKALDLSRLSHQTLLDELKESRQKLSEISGQDVSIVAYPRDAQVSHAELILKKAGYQYAAWISLQGLLEADSLAFRLPRYPLSRKSKLIEIALILSGRLV
jgi:peptidoglycan/xylan/chitin deacetylase (PgdA/CDA1 family)